MKLDDTIELLEQALNHLREAKTLIEMVVPQAIVPQTYEQLPYENNTTTYYPEQTWQTENYFTTTHVTPEYNSYEEALENEKDVEVDEDGVHTITISEER